ncbi:class I SAM-dependent methyltransferase [Labrys neptuniae]
MLLAKRGYRVQGIDISPTAIAWANEIFEAAGHAGRFVQGDVRAILDIGAASFALIFGACLHCLIGADRCLCLAEVRRIPAG